MKKELERFIIIYLEHPHSGINGICLSTWSARIAYKFIKDEPNNYQLVDTRSMQIIDANELEKLAIKEQREELPF